MEEAIPKASYKEMTIREAENGFVLSSYQEDYSEVATDIEDVTAKVQAFFGAPSETESEESDDEMIDALIGEDG